MAGLGAGPLLVKIVMAGESCVGKTSIVRRYTEPAGSPATSYMATIGIDFKVKPVMFNDTRVKLQIWWIMKMLKRAGLKMEPCRTPLVTGCQPDVTPFTVTLCARPVSQLLTHHSPWLSSCGFGLKGILLARNGSIHLVPAISVVHKALFSCMTSQI